MQLSGKQLKLEKEDRQELTSLIERHWTQGASDLQERGKALARWERLWRNMPDPNASTDSSNFQIPLVLWQILNSVAKEIGSLFGEDAEVMVKPVGETDASRVDKVKRWMNWRIRNMGLLRKCYDFAVMRKIFGTAIAYLQWKENKRKVIDLVPEKITEYATQTDPQTGLPAQIPVERTIVTEKEREIVDSVGLDVVIDNIEDWVVPTSASTLDDAEYFIRRLTLTVDEILDLKDQGKLDAELFTPDFVNELYKLVETAKSDLSPGPDPGRAVRDVKDEATAIASVPYGSENKLTIYNWFGRFRLRKKGTKTKSGKPEREERAERIVAFYSPDLKKILGASRLVDIFPDGRLPFIKDDNVRDPNRFWGVGFAELLEPINLEMNAIHNITTDAGLNSVGPVIVYEPVSGFVPEKFKYEPNMCIPVANVNGVKPLQIGAVNMAPYVALMPQLLAMSERLTGLTETQLGRQFSGPNAPRTVGQQQMLQAESSQRIALDIQMQRIAYKEILQRIWEADKRWLPKPFFYRVTEEEGKDVLTDEDMMGDYDFSIGPETAFLNRTQITQEVLQALSLAASSPLIQQNPAVMLAIIRKAFKQLHLTDISSLLPDTSEMAPPQSPEQENVRMLQGEDVDPHPQDNHVRHKEVHGYLLERLDRWDREVPGILFVIGKGTVLAGIRSHIAEHDQAMKTQGASLRMPQGQPPAQMTAGGPNSQLPALGLSNPAAGSVQANLASMLNRGGVNAG